MLVLARICAVFFGGFFLGSIAHGYPPDKQLAATETILKQAELLADAWVA